MPFKIVFLENDGIVHVTYSGTVAKDDHYSALKEALELCANKKSTKLLVDFSKLNEAKLSTLDAFSLAEHISTIKPVMHIAHVYTKQRKYHENIKFASSVETNRGKITGEFKSIKEALTWLRSIG